MTSLQIQTSTTRLAKSASVFQLAWDGLASFVLTDDIVSAQRRSTLNKRLTKSRPQATVRTMKTFAPSSFSVVEPFHGLSEAVMASLAAIDQPWSRRLVKLDAQKRVRARDLITFIAVMRASDSEHWPAPGVFPGEDSGIRAEWHVGRRHAVFEIDADGDMFAYYFDLAAKTSQHAEPKNQHEAVEFLQVNLA